MSGADDTGTAKFPTDDREQREGSPRSPRAGECLGRYRIVERLGAGGMGEVFRAHDPALGRDVAIKIVTGGVGTAESRSRFEQEARAASALSHPNIITIFDIVTDSAEPFIVMELLEGRVLREMLRDPLPMDVLLRLAIQIIEGLCAAHERGIIHRDLKPENVFVTRGGTAKLLDFGVARMQTEADWTDSTAARLTSDGALLGTYGYIAPEVATGGPVDFRVDHFSFGCMLFEMATGKRPFQGQTRLAVLAATLRDEPAPVTSLRRDLPLALSGAIDRCLQKDPAKRFPSTTALREALAAAIDAAVEREAPSHTPSRLPIPPTALVGRQSEVDSLRSLLLDERARLVILTGPGGSGKTRLALAAADSLSSDFRGAVFFVPLAGISDPELVLSAIASVAGASGEAPFDAIVQRLRDTPALLVLDSFEHLIEATPKISELLATCPHLSMIVTSREVLRLYGERNVVVQPLEIPPANATAASAATNPSVALFVARARAASSSFELTEANATAVCALCRRLDGLPLAIELAAARIRLMTPQAMLERLEQRLPLLTAGSRDLPDRQQTMRRTLDWSHDLLSNDERILFRRLSLFAGGFTIDAAQAVADPFEKLSIDVMEGISSLVDKSLLWPSADPDGEARFVMLQTVRDYALELLTASGEEHAARQAHAAYHVVLAQESDQALAGAERPEWLLRISQEHDNIRAALGWLLKQRNGCWGLQLATGMFYFWDRADHLAEGRRWLTALLELEDPAVDPQLYARALFSLGVLNCAAGEKEAGVDLVRKSRDITREHGDRGAIAVTCNALGVLLRDLDRYDEAASSLEESLAHWRDLGDRRNYARSLSNLAGVRQMQRDFETAAKLHTEAEEAFQELGDDSSAAWEINHQGDIARKQMNWTEAERLYSSALSAFRDLGETWGIATSLVDLANVARQRGRLPAAENLFSQSLNEFAALRHQRGLVRVLEAMALLAVDMGNHTRALTLAGAASRIREGIAIPLPEDERQALEVALKKAREASDSERSRSAWQLGRRMQGSEAVTFAQSWPEDELQ